MMFTAALLLGLTTTISATTLFASSYTGNVTTLTLSETNGSYALDATSASSDCGPNPSWLTIDANRGLLFCLNEGLSTPNGSVSSFTINRDGSLKHIQNTTSISGPVNGVIYGDAAGQRVLATAHYSGSAVSSWFLTGGGTFHLDQTFTFNLSSPGAVPDRQAAPHEHQAIVDPTGQYLIVPDLGADLVRVFAIDPDTKKLSITTPLSTTPGTGPRHAAFYNPYTVACETCTTFLYVVGELSGDVTGYAVQYLPEQAGLNFTQVYNSSTLGYLRNDRINAPAEISVTPDNRFLVISNRNSSIFGEVPTQGNSMMDSDSLTTFALQDDGTADFHQVWPTGGPYPRQFAINKAGNMVAVGNQLSGHVVILSRDVATGLVGFPLGMITLDGNVTCVVFNE